MLLPNIHHVLGGWNGKRRDFWLPSPTEAVTWPRWSYPLSHLNQIWICSLPQSAQQPSPLHASICPSPSPAFLPWAHPAHPSPTHPSEWQSTLFPAQNASPSLAPFPSTAAASKPCCRGEGGKRGGMEITTAALTRRPFALCTHVHTWSISCRGSPAPLPPQQHPGLGQGLQEAPGLRFAASCPHGKAQQQEPKHPVRYMLSYGEWCQHVHATNSNYLPLHGNIVSLTKPLCSIQSICHASVFSDHFPVAQHPPESGRAPREEKPLIKGQWGTHACGPPPPLCHARGAGRK